jgi:ribose transport system substrate-binding protein
MRRVLIAVGLIAMAGCSVSSPGSDEPKTKGVIAVSVLTLTNPFFKVIGDTITEEAGKHGYEVVVVSGDNDVVRQQNQMKDFIVRDVAAIVLCPCDSKAIGPAIKEANDAGIPVFTADIACQATDCEVVTHVATDNYSGGKEAGRAMVEALGGAGGKVAIIDHKPVESCQLRVKGFKEVIDNHNRTARGMITVVAELPGGGDKEIGYKAAEDIMQTHPDLAGIFAINDPSALGARAALEKAKKADQVKIIGFDGQLEGKQAIKDGRIFADPIQFPDKIGRETVAAMLEYFHGHQPKPEVLIPTSLYHRSEAEKDPELKQ